MSSRLAGFVAALLLLSACGEPDPTDATADPTVPTAPMSTTVTSDPASAAGSAPASAAGSPNASAEPSPPAGTRVIVGDSEFGPMLFSANGQAIYLFDLEDAPEPRCYRECAAAWPPVLTIGAARAGPGVRTGMLGVAERKDGRTQVTYGGHPLYFYAHEDPGQVLCHDFEDFGGTWYVVKPDGAAAP